MDNNEILEFLRETYPYADPAKVASRKCLMCDKTYKLPQSADEIRKRFICFSCEVNLTTFGTLARAVFDRVLYSNSKSAYKKIVDFIYKKEKEKWDGGFLKK